MIPNSTLPEALAVREAAVQAAVAPAAAQAAAAVVPAVAAVTDFKPINNPIDKTNCPGIFGTMPGLCYSLFILQRLLL